MKKIFKKLIVSLSILLITATNPVMAQAPEPTLQNKLDNMSVKELIIYYANEYKVSSAEISKVAWCESSFNYKAKGDGGKAVGVLQYHKPTFDSFSNLMGQKLDYYSSLDQIKLTSWIWKYRPSYKSHWTCSRITGVL